MGQGLVVGFGSIALLILIILAISPFLNWLGGHGFVWIF